MSLPFPPRFAVDSARILHQPTDYPLDSKPSTGRPNPAVPDPEHRLADDRIATHLLHSGNGPITSGQAGCWISYKIATPELDNESITAHTFGL
jgi:hypothetical protein